MAVADNLAVLKRLHHLDQMIQRKRDRLSKSQRKVVAKQALMEQLEQDLGVRQQQMKQLKMQSDKKELDLKMVENEVGQLQQKLNAARKQDEYDAIRTQMDARKMACETFEDEILEALTNAEVLQAECMQTEQELERARQELEQLRDDAGQEKAQQETDLAKLERERAEEEAHLNPTVRETYAYVFDKLGDDCIAEMDPNERTCFGCFTQMGLQVLDKLLLGEGIVQCGSCGRILFLGEQ